MNKLLTKIARFAANLFTKKESKEQPIEPTPVAPQKEQTIETLPDNKSKQAREVTC